MSVLSIENLSLIFEQKLLFDNFSCHLSVGKVHCLLGRSGTGKSTLLKLLTRSYPLPEKTLIKFKSAPLEISNIAYLPQEDCLLPWLSVLDNVLLPQRLTKTLSEQSTKAALALLEKMQLTDSIDSNPKQLSGGMRQRVALARTLLMQRPVMLLDEPFAKLDTVTKLQLEPIIKSYLSNKTVLWVTHDPLEAARLTDSIYLLQENDSLKKVSLEKQFVQSYRDLVENLYA